MLARKVHSCQKCADGRPVLHKGRHIFWHLARDKGLVRYRCLFPHCQREFTERRDVEVHLKLFHKERAGRAEDLVEDRYEELEWDGNEMAKELFAAEDAFVEKKRRRRLRRPPQEMGEVQCAILQYIP